MFTKLKNWIKDILIRIHNHGVNDNIDYEKVEKIGLIEIYLLDK